MKVNGKDYPQHIVESHLKAMFQTTNQNIPSGNLT